MHLFSINNTDSVQEKINNENLFQMVLSQISNKGCDMCVEEPVPYVISRAESKPTLHAVSLKLFNKIPFILSLGLWSVFCYNHKYVQFMRCFCHTIK